MRHWGGTGSIIVIMVTIKTAEDIVKLRQGGKILASILRDLRAYAAIGVTSLQMEDMARKLTLEAGARPAFLGYTPQGARRPYPAALCLSVNDVVVHGIPNEGTYIFKDGDIITIDMGISYKDMIVDSAITVGLGTIDEKGKKLLEAGEKALSAAIFVCKPGIKTGDLGQAIEESLDFYHKKYGFTIAEGLGGHGVGYEVHEDPFVPNFGKKNQGVLLKPGMVIAIEPILNEGSGEIKMDDDDYTYRTADGMRSVHFEHTVLITETGVEILTE